jgi:hypothetical protein
MLVLLRGNREVSKISVSVGLLDCLESSHGIEVRTGKPI